MHLDVVMVGHVLCETIVFANGRRVGPLLGSPAAYSGAVTAHLGLRTGIVTKVGPDAPPGLLQPLRDVGVDFSGIDFKSPITTTNQLVYAPDGTKVLKYVMQAEPIAPHDIPERFRGAAAFHICPLDYEVPVETVRFIRGLGGVMSVDMGGYGGAHVSRATADQKRFPTDQLMNLVRCFDIVKASDEDARLIFAEERLSEAETAQRFVDWGAKISIVTRGERGSLVFMRDARFCVPAIPGHVIDVTGGGDSYIAGFLTEFVRTHDPWLSGVFASAVALCVIEKTGGVCARRMPSEAEARARIPSGVKIQHM
ncbi:MAG: carbohydrate kinase family protein [Terriglobia bacterium]